VIVNVFEWIYMKIMQVKDGIPVKLWTEDIEQSAHEQIVHISRLPFAFHHIAIMADCHCGFGMPIGGVLATAATIVPNAVGFDIGCGMCAGKSSVLASDLNIEVIKKLISEIKRRIPLGVEHHNHPQDGVLMPDTKKIDGIKDSIIKTEYASALKQLGTLGGGNHFIEFQKDIDGFLWVMVHSGSRNLGKKVADYYNQKAIRINEKEHFGIPIKWDLAHLHFDSKEGQSYFNEMQYCVDFALANRKLIMHRIMDILASEIKQISFGGIINIAHNYASTESHFGKNIIVHRKGATLASTKTAGIIPGSQGSKSYIVKGLGNPESFMSCSHGAGRMMSRNEARRRLNLKDEVNKLEKQGIVHSIKGVSDLDEAPSAYKNIKTVMEAQTDLVSVIKELAPLAVIKG
jgi:tRNA-splicing ligase RtcB